MKMIIMSWALSCLTATGVSARDTQPYINDTLRTIELGEFTVKARQRIVKGDRKVLLPTAEQVKMSADGLELLQKLHIPRITVNAMTGEIGMTGQGNVVLCINGVKVSDRDIADVRPADIVRIEYHDSPGARWGSADAVINYVTRHHESGGSVSGDFFDAVGNGVAGINSISVKHNRGRSEWSFNAGSFGQVRNNWIREYEEKRISPAGVSYRRETGQPVKIGGNSMESMLNYSYTVAGKSLFNIRTGYTLNDVPYSELGDRSNILYTSDADKPLTIYEHMTERSHSPSLDLYWQRTFKGGQQIIFDVVGTYIKTGSKRTYRESADNDPVTDVFSDIDGRKYSVIAEGLYEKNAGNNKFTGGMRHMQAYTDNRYEGTATADVSMHQAETSLYTEYQRQSDKWSYAGSLTGTLIYYSQSGRHKETYSVQPSARISFIPDERWYIRYRADMKTSAPSLSDMNDVEQEIDAGQVRRGNPDLNAFHTLNQSLATGYGSGFFNADVILSYKHEYHPIMESVIYDNGIFVRTYENQKSFGILRAEATLTIRPWKDHLSVSLTPEVTRYFSRGNTYRHTYTMSKFIWNVDFSYGNWMLAYNTMLGKDNYMYGEQITEEKSMHLITAGYRQPKWSVKIGAINPFLKEYRMETCNRSALNPSVSRAYTRKTLYFLVKLDFNLNYGRQTKGNGKKIHNEDKDAGIMQGNKGM